MQSKATTLIETETWLTCNSFTFQSLKISIQHKFQTYAWNSYWNKPWLCFLLKKDRKRGESSTLALPLFNGVMRFRDTIGARLPNHSLYSSINGMKRICKNTKGDIWWHICIIVYAQVWHGPLLLLLEYQRERTVDIVWYEVVEDCRHFGDTYDQVWPCSPQFVAGPSVVTAKQFQEYNTSAK